jgi:stage III sporulation protein AF
MIVMFTSWVKTIIFVVLFASFLEVLLPNSSMQRFVRVIMGLFIMLAILSPVIEVVQNHLTPSVVPTLSGNSANSAAILNDANHFAHGREELSAELYKKQLAQQMQVMITAVEGVADAKVVIDMDTNNSKVKDQIRGVEIYITPGVALHEGQIKEVVIGEERRPAAELTIELKTKVQNLIAELYQLPKEVVAVKKMHS